MYNTFFSEHTFSHPSFPKYTQILSITFLHLGCGYLDTRKVGLGNSRYGFNLPLPPNSLSQKKSFYFLKECMIKDEMTSGESSVKMSQLFIMECLDYLGTVKQSFIKVLSRKVFSNFLNQRSSISKAKAPHAQCHSPFLIQEAQRGEQSMTELFGCNN